MVRFVFANGHPANPVTGFSMRRRNILLLLGEKAGMRESVATSFPPTSSGQTFLAGAKSKL